MVRTAFLLVALALNSVDSKGTLKSQSILRGANPTPDPGEALDACSCDCCMAIEDDRRMSGSSTPSGLQCQPKSLIGSGAGDTCATECAVSADMSDAFQSISGAVDYGRFCLGECAPGGNQANVNCLSKSLVPVPAPSKPAPVISAPSPHQAMTQMQSNTSTADKSASDASEGGASLSLARGEMMQAKLQAQLAGESARVAKEAYEKIMRSSKVMAEAAGAATMREVKHEARLQATEAKNIRETWVKNAQKNAQKAAVSAAMVYKKAMLRDLGLAGQFMERAGQYAGAASTRQAYANQLEAQATNYGQRNEPGLMQQYVLMAKQAVDQGASFDADAKALKKQADTIMASLPWYNYTEYQAAEHMLKATTPPEILLPPLPPLP